MSSRVKCNPLAAGDITGKEAIFLKCDYVRKRRHTANLTAGKIRTAPVSFAGKGWAAGEPILDNWARRGA